MNKFKKVALFMAMFMTMVLPFSASADYEPNWGEFGASLEMYNSNFDFDTTNIISGQEVKTNHSTETDLWNLALQYKHQGNYGFARLWYKKAIDGDYELTFKQSGISGCGNVCGSTDTDYWQMGGEVLWRVPVNKLDGKLFMGGRFTHSEMDTGSYNTGDLNSSDGLDQTFVSAVVNYQIQRDRWVFDFNAGLGIGEVNYKTFGQDSEVPNISESLGVDVDGYRLDLEAGARYELARGVSIRGYVGYAEIFDSSVSSTYNASIIPNIKSSAGGIDSSEVFVGGMMYFNFHDLTDQTKDLYPKAH
ncbi:MAG TPA: hypothetical protein DCL21_02415 [Alphaproteobacteria bacterium]|nr:hypothetical protein [Alphaproteobacteria bacterium]